jgi:hypothetical protein
LLFELLRKTFYVFFLLSTIQKRKSENEDTEYSQGVFEEVAYQVNSDAREDGDPLIKVHQLKG